MRGPLIRFDDFVYNDSQDHIAFFQTASRALKETIPLNFPLRSYGRRRGITPTDLRQYSEEQTIKERYFTHDKG